MTREEVEAAIAQIEKTLNDGISSVTTDGTTTVVDLAQQERRLSKLKRQLEALKRPTSMTIHLGDGV